MLADGLGFDSGVIPGIFEGTITVTNTNDSGAGSLRNAVAPPQDEPTQYFNGSNGVLTVAASTFSGAGEGPDSLTEYFNGSNGVLTVAGEKEDILTRGVYSEASSYFTITAGNDNDVFFATTRDRLIGTLGGNDTISYYEMAEPTTTDSSIIDTLGGNGSSGSDGADTLLASYFGGNGSSESDSTITLYGASDIDSINSLDDSIGSTFEASEFGTPASSAEGLGSIFELTSGQPFSSQTETSGRTYIPPGGGTVILWPPRFNSAMVEGTARDGLIDMLGDNGFSGSDGADTLLASYFGGNGSSESDGTSTLYGGMDDSLNGNNQTLIIEPPTDQLFSSGVSSVETTFTSTISGNNSSFAVLLDSANTNAAAKNDGAWRATSAFETDSFGTPASSAGGITISGNNSSRVIL